jgi:hypothetical protein
MVLFVVINIIINSPVWKSFMITELETILLYDNFFINVYVNNVI